MKLFSGIKTLAAVALATVLVGCAGTRSDQSTGEKFDSMAITTKVKAALLDDPMVKGTSVNVDTFRGTVQLNGFVETPEAKTRAEQVAWGVNGVQSVQNNLQIKSQVQPDEARARDRDGRSAEVNVDVDAD